MNHWPQSNRNIVRWEGRALLESNPSAQLAARHRRELVSHTISSLHKAPDVLPNKAQNSGVWGRAPGQHLVCQKERFATIDQIVGDD
jgi:hypothetical protein